MCEEMKQYVVDLFFIRSSRQAKKPKLNTFQEFFRLGIILCQVISCVNAHYHHSDEIFPIICSRHRHYGSLNGSGLILMAARGCSPTREKSMLPASEPMEASREAHDFTLTILKTYFQMIDHNGFTTTIAPLRTIRSTTSSTTYAYASYVIVYL